MQEHPVDEGLFHVVVVVRGILNVFYILDFGRDIVHVDFVVFILVVVGVVGNIWEVFVIVVQVGVLVVVVLDGVVDVNFLNFGLGFHEYGLNPVATHDFQHVVAVFLAAVDDAADTVHHVFGQGAIVNEEG